MRRIINLTTIFLAGALWVFQAGSGVAQEYGSKNGDFSERRLRSLAEEGHLPAILDMARRHLQGDGVDRNRGVAWYWLKRAQQANADISLITTIPLERLLEEMDEKERFVLAYLAHVHDDLDLSGINIPPSFQPLTHEVPEPLTDQEVVTYMEKFRGLKKHTDIKAYLAVEHELMARTGGLRYLGNLSIHAQIRPLGMDNDEFVLRICNYQRSIERIFPKSRMGPAEQLRQKELALSVQFEKRFIQNVEDILQCGRIYPTLESRGMAEALLWAKSLNQMNPVALRELAAKHFEIFGSSSLRSFNIERINADPEESYVLFSHYLLANKIQRFAEFKEQIP
ncbi:hypothetical protein JCM17960_32260 [Magnetospira thiophila]